MRRIARLPLGERSLFDVSADSSLAGQVPTHEAICPAEGKIQLQRRRSWCITTDPEFGPKAADVVVCT